jgi:hypothetical protein
MCVPPGALARWKFARGDAASRHPLRSPEMSRTPDFQFWAERSVLILPWRADQREFVTASLDGPNALRIGPCRITARLDLPDHLLSRFVNRIGTVISHNWRIRLSRIVSLHRSYRRTQDDLSESPSPSKSNLPLNRTTPIVFLFAVLVLVIYGGDEPWTYDRFLKALFLSQRLAR